MESKSSRSRPARHPLDESLRDAAAAEGFSLLGVAPAVSSTGFSQLVEWVESGYAGSMDYFAKRLEAYEHPRFVLSDVRSMIVFAYPYDASPRYDVRQGFGRIARYVGDGNDYHDVIHPKLKRMGKVIRSVVPDASVRGIVDTAPLMEREVAVAAGLGWQGKNTLLLNRFHGSYFLLACLLTSAELPLTEPHTSDHCGTCTACLDACPTQAFPQPGTLDATRCISYLTIESRDPIPSDLRPMIGDWLFGCDVCQDVCPWNRKPSRRVTLTTPSPSPNEWSEIDLNSLFFLDDDQFRSRYRKTPLWRSRRRGILRNAAIVLGNQRDCAALPALAKGLNDSEDLVRGASAWAIGNIDSHHSTQLLSDRLQHEPVQPVLQEIRDSLARLSSQQPS